jgi:hypothetical protein
MAHPRIQPMTLPGWAPLAEPPYRRRRRRPFALGRWLWPAAVVGSFLALVGYVLAHDPPTAGVSGRGLVTVALAAVVLAVLSVRRVVGARALLRTLAEYAVVAVLAVSLVTLEAVEAPARSPARAQDTGRPVLVVLAEAPGNVRDWLVDLWQRAGRQVDQHPHPTPPPGGSS